MALLTNCLTSPFPLLCLLLLALSSTMYVEARIRHYRWEITYQFKSPDCFRKLSITVNGETPGPVIDAQEGDTIVVDVKNSLVTENVAIHWHGIRQIGTPWSDGTAGVTQCPIEPGETFIYKFVVDRAGTFIYHAHYGMQRSAGLYGLIRVALPAGEVEPFSYDYDRSIILNDWWHNSTYELATGLTSIPFVWVGEPQSLLINGKGRFNCSLAGSIDVCNTTNPECSPFVLTVVPGKTYHLRIASITSLSALSFEIEGHNLTIVKTDGNNVLPIVVNKLNIYSGETYSVLFTANQNPTRNYWVTTNVVSRMPTTPTGLAILNYYPNSPTASPPTTPTSGPQWNDSLPRLHQSQRLHAHPSVTKANPTPLTSNKVIHLLNTQNKVNGYMRWSINNVSYSLPHTPYLIALKHKLHHIYDQYPAPEKYNYSDLDIYSVASNYNATESSAIYRLKFNSVVDVVLQNANTMTMNTSETHPWHLHGHDFWVLGYGLGKFDPERDPKNYNLVDPVMKNTVPVHPYGWTVIRFRADNPGVWAFHCHIESHLYLGMGAVFEEGVERVGKLPREIFGCGAYKGLRGK